MSLIRVSLIAFICAMGFFSSSSNASSAIQQTKGDFQDKFRQLAEGLPTPNV
jgi:hypothetical protein